MVIDRDLGQSIVYTSTRRILKDGVPSPRWWVPSDRRRSRDDKRLRMKMSSSKVAGNSPAKITNNKGEQQEFPLGLDKDASEHSISSMMSCVSISPKHAESSLRVMESYLHRQQLTDVTLIAGERTGPDALFDNRVDIVYISVSIRKLSTAKIIHMIIVNNEICISINR